MSFTINALPILTARATGHSYVGARLGKDRVAYAQVVFTLVVFTLLSFYLWDTQEAEYVGPPIISY